MFTRTLLLFSISSSVFCSSVHLPVSGEVKKRVAFWKRVYTEITSRQAFAHDSKDVRIIYKTLALPKSRRLKKRFFRREKKRIQRILESMSKKKRRDFNRVERKMAKIIGKKSSREIKELSRNIRFQVGLRDRYYKGLIRSHMYLPYIREIYQSYKLPAELVYLPHVESSFNGRAYSKVGAAGMWQFMRATARIYGLKVSYTVDERLDFLKSTRASAKLLRNNYRKLKSWPLAITAYNHGMRSMERAVSRLKTRNISSIIKHYKGRRFKFASKNFYATFMATVEISKDPTKYFPSFIPPKKLSFSTLELPKSSRISQVKKILGQSTKVIKKYNPSIRRSAYRSNLSLPKGFRLYFPSVSNRDLKKYKLAFSKIKMPKKMHMDGRVHIVSRGDNIYDIARFYKTNIHALAGANNISNPSKIFPGQKLRIPASGRPRSSSKRKSSRVKNIVRANKKSSSVSLQHYNLDLKAISRNLYVLTVEVEETLGHYAEWAQVPLNRIRKLNGLRRKSAIYLGQKLRIRMTSNKLETFTQSRRTFHRAIQEDFFNSYAIFDHKKYSIKKGEILNQILREASLPFWLVRKEQPQGFLDPNIKMGQVIILPRVGPIAKSHSI